MIREAVAISALLFAIALPAFSETSGSCDTSGLDAVRKMFPEREMVEARELVRAQTPFRPSSTIQCQGDVRDDGKIGRFRQEEGSVGEMRYRVSYRDGAGAVEVPGSRYPWTITCKTDAISDDIDCVVTRLPAVFWIRAYPAKPGRIVIGGNDRTPGATVAVRVDRHSAHVSTGDGFRGAAADSIVSEMEHGTSLLVRWKQWPRDTTEDVAIELDGGFKLAMELARWAGSHIKP